MNFFSAWRKTHRVLLCGIYTYACTKDKELFLVGGAVRDILLKREKQNPDLDFCLTRGAIPFARAVALALDAGFVVLDREHGCGRVVKKLQGRVYTLDFSDFRCPTLTEDLLHRDFTINSLAMRLDKKFFTEPARQVVIDCCGGRRDLTKGIIRLANPKSFDEDPLRILRAFGFAASCAFRIDTNVYRLIREKKNKLRLVSPERIRDELFRVLASPRGYAAIADLDRTGVLELVLPEVKKMRAFEKGKHRRLDVWRHTLATYQKIEALFARTNKKGEVRAYLAQEVSSGRTREAVVKLAALLHDIGKPKTFKIKKGTVTFYGHERVGAQMAQDSALRLKLSNEEVRMIKRIVFMHLRPGYLVTNPVLTSRAKFRFFRDSARDAGAILLLALADERATVGYVLLNKIRARYERVIPRLIKEYFAKEKQPPVVRLVNGNDIMEHFRLEPSPLIGTMLGQIEELQAIGTIATKEEALAACAKILKNA